MLLIDANSVMYKTEFENVSEDWQKDEDLFEFNNYQKN